VENFTVKQNGFTLIEIAIVLVIIGLLLGSVFKGQEMIVAARVRNLASQVEGCRIAYLGFFDRYRVLPGDMTTPAANANIPGAPGGCTGGVGCGNGVIDGDEVYVVWAQLSKSGMINGDYTGVITDPGPTAANNPANPFGGHLQIVNDAKYDDVSNPAQPALLNIKTGAFVPAGVLAELDLKIDDGLPVRGAFRSTAMVPATSFDGSVICVTGAGASAVWDNSGTDPKNCGGVLIH
jgi:prepilin-type N-terminal cleavage/methylation domain-containing protein